MKKVKMVVGAFCLVALLVTLFFLAPTVKEISTYAPAVAMLLGAMAFGTVCIPVGSVPEFCGSNPGGQVQLYVIRAADLASIPAPAAEGDLVVTGNIVPKASKAFAHWHFAVDTSDLIIKAVGEEGNQSWEVSASAYIPGGNPLVSKVMNNILNTRCVIIMIDAKGQKRIGGTIRRGMMCVPEYSSGKVFNEKNGYVVTFKTGMAHEPFFYEGEIPVAATV